MDTCSVSGTNGARNLLAQCAWYTYLLAQALRELCASGMHSLYTHERTDAHAYIRTFRHTEDLRVCLREPCTSLARAVREPCASLARALCEPCASLAQACKHTYRHILKRIQNNVHTYSTRRSTQKFRFTDDLLARALRKPCASGLQTHTDPPSAHIHTCNEARTYTHPLGRCACARCLRKSLREFLARDPCACSVCTVEHNSTQ